MIEHEIENRKYHDVIMLLPLADGRFAVLNNARQLQFISINPLARFAEVKQVASRAQQWVAKQPVRSTISLEELGL